MTGGRNLKIPNFIQNGLWI